jgi:hypothetical protein
MHAVAQSLPGLLCRRLLLRRLFCAHLRQQEGWSQVDGILNSFNRRCVNKVSLGITHLRHSYSSGQLTPAAVMHEVYRRIRGAGERPAWISLVSEEQTLRHAQALGAFTESLPLYGVPFAIKDNIDLAGVPTTAACPDFAYTPDRSAVVVAKLMAAGAIPIGEPISISSQQAL